MNIITLIVLFNPKEEFFKNYEGYSSFSSHVLFIDNSTSGKDYSPLIKAIPHSLYFSMGGNKGIAAALKRGMEIAISLEADYVLTMDQDSVFPFASFPVLEPILKTNKDYGIIGLNFNSQETSLKIRDVSWWLTSGNFIDGKKYAQLKQGFNADLFIDAVDADICHSFWKAGYKVGYIPGLSLLHEMGTPKKKRFGFLHFTTLNYKPIRYYYIFRNNTYLYHKDPKFFRKNFFNVRFKMKIKVKLFEKGWKKNRQAIRLGVQDAKKGILGPCRHSEILEGK